MLLFNAVQLGTLTWVSVGIWGSRGTGHLFLFPALNFFSASEVSAWCSCRISLFFPLSRKALLTLRCLIQFSLSAEPQTVSVCLSVHPSHWVSHFHTKPPLMLIALLGPLAESLCQWPPAVTTRCHPGLFQGDIMATETRGHSWCFISVGQATAVTRPVSCGAIGLTDVNRGMTAV